MTKKKIFLIAGGVLLIILIVMISIMSNGLSEGANVALNGINLSNIPDGSYTGVYDFKRWSNTAMVHVKDGKIIGIDIVSDMFGAGVTNSSRETFRRVIDAQDTRIDAVAGATVSSKAYLKAIEDAFND